LTGSDRPTTHPHRRITHHHRDLSPLRHPRTIRSRRRRGPHLRHRRDGRLDRDRPPRPVPSVLAGNPTTDL